MKLIIGVLLLTVGLGSAQLITRVVDLRVDHFNPLDRRTFDCRYFLNRQFYFEGGPVYIHVKSGFELFHEFLLRGAVYEIAQETRGHIFSLEPRFYGESRPTEDTSVENLRWLTVEQTLADMAQFVSFIRANYNGTANSPVILFGSGFGGSIALWARQKYPNLIDGVWASSAPVNAVANFPQFMPNVFNTINSFGGPECGNILRGAFRMIDDAVRLRDTAFVEQRLRLCSPIDIDIDEEVTRLFYGIAADIGFLFVSHARYPDIEAKCNLMRGTAGNLPENDLDGFARWFADEFNRNLDCLDYNNTATVALYQQTAWNTISTNQGRRQTFWLQCTQLGQFPIANEGEGHPFGWRFDAAFFRLWCGEAFGHELFTADFIEESIARTNQFYGGLSPHIYRAFLTHGEMDPKRSLGPSDDLNPNSPVVVMPLQSHARDFGPPADADDAILVATQARARELILQWVGEARQARRAAHSAPTLDDEIY